MSGLVATYQPGRGLPGPLLYGAFLAPVMAGGGVAVAAGQAWAGGLATVLLAVPVAYVWGRTVSELRLEPEGLVLEHRLGARRWRRTLAARGEIRAASFHQHHEEVELEVVLARTRITLGPFQDPAAAQRLVEALAVPEA